MGGGAVDESPVPTPVASPGWETPVAEWLAAGPPLGDRTANDAVADPECGDGSVVYRGSSKLIPGEPSTSAVASSSNG